MQNVQKLKNDKVNLIEALHNRIIHKLKYLLAGLFLLSGGFMLLLSESFAIVTLIDQVFLFAIVLLFTGIFYCMFYTSSKISAKLVFNLTANVEKTSTMVAGVVFSLIICGLICIFQIFIPVAIGFTIYSYQKKRHLNRENSRLSM